MAALRTTLENLSDSEMALLIAVVGALVTVLVAIIGTWVNLAIRRQEQRRILYSEAIRAALSWNEMLYRVRRRGKDETPGLVAKFHDLQEEQTYYRAWIGTDSRYMQRSYDRLVRTVKNATQSLIRQAWKDPLRAAPGDHLPDDEDPDLNLAVESFIADVRSHLSLWLVPRVQPIWRNRRSRSS